jgi:hypothetical protein
MSIGNKNILGENEAIQNNFFNILPTPPPPSLSGKNEAIQIIPLMIPHPLHFY